MTEFLPQLPWFVLRATCFLSAGALVTLLAARWLQGRSLRTESIAWTLVLLAGAIVAPAQLNIPWYEPATAAADPFEADALPEAAEEEVVESPTEANVAGVASPQHVKPSDHWLRWCFDSAPAFWLLGMGCVGIAALGGYAGLLYALRSTWRPQRRWREEYLRVAAEMDIERPPCLRVHSHIGPLLCLTPIGYRLVIPADRWPQLTPTQRTLVLRHELAHYQRGDVWRSLRVRLLALLHWFNPLAWLAARRIEEASEWAADERALENHREQTGELAAALLQLAQNATSTRMLASAAQGRSLARRLTHLIEHTEQGRDEPMSKKVLLIALLLGILTAGAVQVHLVAQELENEPPTSASRVTSETAKTFASKLVGDDELTKSLKSALQSPAGALVLRDRAGQYEAEARQAAAEEAVPKLFDDLFDKTGDELKLKANQAEFRQKFLKNSQALSKDVAGLQAAFRAHAQQLEVDSDLSKLVHRLLTHESAPIIVYVRQIRPRMRPGRQVIERVLGEMFALRSDGKYEIRLDIRPQAEQQTSNFEGRVKMIKTLHVDLAEFAKDISAKDDLHKKVIEALSDPMFATSVGVESFRGQEKVGRAAVEKILENLEGGFREAGDGLVIRDDTREDVEKFLRERDEIRRAAKLIKSALHEFADMVADDDELHRQWRKMLKTDLALVRVANRVEYATADIGEAVKSFLSQILEEGDGGKLRVKPQEVDEEDLVEGISNVFRMARAARRKGREVTAFIDRIADADLKAAMASPGGKILIGDELRTRAMREAGDGFANWVKEHFEEAANGKLSIRDDAREEMEGVVEQTNEVKQELENADF